MRFEAARAVADAVLYEGYALYPYRATSDKNQVRWQWGVVGPQGAERDGAGEGAVMQTECLVEAGSSTAVDVVVRFLQVQARTVEQAVDGHAGEFTPVERLETANGAWLPWGEAVEQQIERYGLWLADLQAGAQEIPVQLPGNLETQPVAEGDHTLGRLVRRRWPLEGTITLSAEPVADRDGLVRLRVRLENLAEWDPTADDAADASGLRDVALRRSLVAAHTLLGVQGGAFVSLAGPPEAYRQAAAGCENIRTWPVLIGDPENPPPRTRSMSDADEDQPRDLVLSSPIILSDYPEIAPESQGALFDSTEIDELLTLRVLTLTEEEKRDARATDPRVAEIIDRAEQMPAEAYEQLHGAVRHLAEAQMSAGGPQGNGDGPEVPWGGPDDPLGGVGDEPWSGAAPAAWEASPQASGEGPPEAPWGRPDAPWWDPGVDASVSPDSDTVTVQGVPVGRGSRVRLSPTRRADVQDVFLAGREATVAAVYFDVDGEIHVAVTIDDDPGADLNDEFGRYWYFAPYELEPLDAGAPGPSGSPDPSGHDPARGGNP